MSARNIWDAEVARNYDTPGRGMFAPEVVNPTVDRLVELARGGPVLEFAVGTGRIAIPLARRGLSVTGIELSPAMIAQLRTKADEATLPVVHGDMATARASGRYTLVYLIYNTISNLLSQDEQIECFRNAARHLVAGGRFVVELGVPDPRGPRDGANATVFAAEPGYVGVDTYDLVNQRVDSHHFRYGESGEARLFRSPHRYIWPSELDLMGQLAGFSLESRHADWNGGEFISESTSHVSVYTLSGEA
ncbi:MAG: class I SAM-dependent methyltransferase [Spirochaetota bacterium]